MDEEKTMTKVIRIGTVKVGKSNQSVFCSIKFDGKCLSISGVVGPRKSGNCVGSCGQINMGFSSSDITSWAPGWNKEKLDRFLELWDKWHLNDMRAGCKHQRAENWGKEKITLVDIEVETWRINLKDGTKEAIVRMYHWYRECKDVQKGVIMKKDETPEQRKIRMMRERSKLAQFINHPTTQPVLRFFHKVFTSALNNESYVPKDTVEESWYAPNGPIKIKTEEKYTNWVHPTEHPKGVLTKECPVCGYRYGSKWLLEDVPQDVLDWLFDLPKTDKVPAWV